MANEGDLFSGEVLAGGKWTVTFVPNTGLHYYLFTAKLLDTAGNTGTLTLQTAAIRTPYIMFNKTIGVDSFTITLAMR